VSEAMTSTKNKLFEHTTKHRLIEQMVRAEELYAQYWRHIEQVTGREPDWEERPTNPLKGYLSLVELVNSGDLEWVDEIELERHPITNRVPADVLAGRRSIEEWARPEIEMIRQLQASTDERARARRRHLYEALRREFENDPGPDDLSTSP
jgi:hypothetical protein